MQENLNFKRIFLIVMDSVGIGEAPDAAQFDDLRANTLGHIAEHNGGLFLPHLASLGLGNIAPIQGVPQSLHPLAYHTKMQEASNGKDTMTGHWEMMGLHVPTAFRVFPDGFPPQLIKELEQKTGRKIIGNKPASGTVILEELGVEHMKTGALIVYTSADSVIQIASHEEIVPLRELYAICELTRKITLRPEYRLGRVIARPFLGKKGNFKRTANRHDYALKPFGKTVMNELAERNYDVIALGKISDIYSGEGVTQAIRTVSNMDGMDKLIDTLNKEFVGLSFLNLVDFDALYGHRRDPEGYKQALEQFDRRLPTVIKALKEDDLLIITADHGNDPLHHGTDHTREYVPLLLYSKKLKHMHQLPVCSSFADVGATIAHNFAVPLPKFGQSLLSKLL